MEEYQKQFLKFAIESEVLQFGAFELKSGRNSPYFFNAGLFNSGAVLRRVGQFYAEALVRSGIEFDMLFGPAYKGIPLVSTTAIALAEQQGMDVPYAFNRKEVKDHGEGGNLVGAPLKGDVVIVDDVITAGTAIREVMTLLEESEARAVGVIVAIDRQEKGKGELSAIQEVERDYDVEVVSVVKLEDLIEFARTDAGLEPRLQSMEDYRNKYGIAC
ncbi:MAG: orotate phosphoribosyltransferase [Pseudomonadales bacterium]|nr:orotate phosphoribosyltransferase [Pseudomonadales bacterium]